MPSPLMFDKRFIFVKQLCFNDTQTKYFFHRFSTILHLMTKLVDVNVENSTLKLISLFNQLIFKFKGFSHSSQAPCFLLLMSSGGFLYLERWELKGLLLTIVCCCIPQSWPITNEPMLNQLSCSGGKLEGEEKHCQSLQHSVSQKYDSNEIITLVLFLAR